MGEKTFTVAAPSNIDITLDDGSPAFRLNAGLNHNVPDAVAHHWYAKASGCTVVTAEAKPEAKPDMDAARKEAEELGVKVDGRWSHERLLEEIAEAKAGK